MIQLIIIVIISILTIIILLFIGKYLIYKYFIYKNIIYHPNPISNIAQISNSIKSINHLDNSIETTYKYIRDKHTSLNGKLSLNSLYKESLRAEVVNLKNKMTKIIQYGYILNITNNIYNKLHNIQYDLNTKFNILINRIDSFSVK